jgi:hypothetical protein
MDRILPAASELVSRKGFEALTIEAPAAKLHTLPRRSARTDLTESDQLNLCGAKGVLSHDIGDR